MLQNSMTAALALYLSSVVAFPHLESRQTAAVAPAAAQWKQAEATDARSPCPGLNTLANYGIINRSGKGISVEQIAAGATALYNFSPGPFESVAKSAIKMLASQLRQPGLLDLDVLRTHNAIEHDASLSRDDIIQGNNFAINKTLVEQLVSVTPGSTLSVAELGYIRSLRNTQSQALGSPPLSGKLLFGSLLESALVLNVHGKVAADGSLVAPKDSVKHWFLNEQMIPGYIPQQKSPGNLDFLLAANAVKSAANKYKSGPSIRETLIQSVFDFIDMDKVKRGIFEVISDADAKDPSKFEGMLAMHGFPVRA